MNDYQMVKLGKYKIAHWDRANKMLHSEMFGDLGAAQSLGHKLEKDGYQYIIMENVYVGDGTYGWIPLVVGGLPILAAGGVGMYGLYKAGGIFYEIWKLRWAIGAVALLWIFRPRRGGSKE